MIELTINKIKVEAHEGETILEVAKRTGVEIPHMCYVPGKEHKPSCMVCMVKNVSNGQLLPSCSSLAMDGMVIETDNDEIHEMRKMSLELLLSDHRADCEAPCVIACPHNLNVEGVLYHYDKGQYKEARQLMAAVFKLPEIACDDCKGPCEKICRRGTVDKHVEIKAIMRELTDMGNLPVTGNPNDAEVKDKNRFNSKVGRFSPHEQEWLKASIDVKSRCIHCACSARHECKLRGYASDEGIKSPRFGVSSSLPFKIKQHVTGRLWFEPAKCVRCGLCVYNTQDGFTFKGRGFGMQVVIPDESKEHVSEDLAKLCPTGALYIDS